MKRFFSLLLLFCLFLSLFTACAGTGPDIMNNGDDTLDFCGNKFVIAVSDCINDFPPTKGETSSGDRILERLNETEKVYNLKFEWMPKINPSTTFLMGAVSGGLQADLIYTCNKQLYDAYLINTILPAENVVNNPESEKWMSPAFKAKTLYGNKIYGLFPNYWEISPGALGFININMDLLEEYSIDDPQGYIESGEWNWENFRGFLEQTTFTDGDKQWMGMGMVTDCVASLFPFVLGNGGSFIRESNGRTVLNVNSPEAMEAYDFIADLGARGLITDRSNTDQGFGDGKTWMVVSGGPTAGETFDIAQLRFPYGPRGNKDTVSTLVNEIRIWAFPIFSAYTEEEVGEVTEFLFEPLCEDFPNGWKDVVGDNLFYHQSEYEYYITAAEQSEYFDIYIFTETFKLMKTALFDILKGNQNPANAIDAVYDVMNEEINAQYNN